MRQALRFRALLDRYSGLRCASRRRKLRSAILNLPDLRFHPLLKRRFEFCLIILGLQIFDCFARLVQGNEVTGDLIR